MSFQNWYPQKSELAAKSIVKPFVADKYYLALELKSLDSHRVNTCSRSPAKKGKVE